MFDVMMLRPFLKPSTGIGRGHGKRNKGKSSTKTTTTQTTTNWITLTIPQAKTIEEANQIGKSLGVAQYPDFTGLDVSVANEMIRELAETQKMFTNLGGLIAYGGHEAVQKRLFGRVIDVGGEGIYWDRDRSICLLNFKFSSSEIQKTRERYMWRERTNYMFHPVGTHSVRGVISHEIGHMMDYRFKISSDTRIRELFTRYALGTISGPNTNEYLPYTVNPVPEKMMRALSSYANTNIREFVAEAWSEYRNNPSPRPLAKQVGDIMVEIASRKVVL